MPTLEQKLQGALDSRDQRLIRRRLFDPSEDENLVDFHTNDYLSLSTSPLLRSLFLKKLNSAPSVLGSGGSRLLVNGLAHHNLEARLTSFFDSPAALLFNSGFDANIGFFSCVPQAGDIVIYDEFIHASVHDGIRASRVTQSNMYSFEHNSLPALASLLLHLSTIHPSLLSSSSSTPSQQTNIFLAVESLYSMDGTLAPLTQMIELMETMFPEGNGYIVVDEAHATGVYGPSGRGLVAELGLERRVLARLHTFGKALAGSGAVLLTTPLIRDYMLNYARSLIYTTSLSYANIVSVDCSFDLLEDGTAQKLASKLLDLSTQFTSHLLSLLQSHSIPPSLLCLPPHFSPQNNARPHSRTKNQNTSTSKDLTSPSLSTLPSPIIPLLTPHPRPLSLFLRSHKKMNARPITWPTVPKGGERVRVCLHSGNTREEVKGLAEGVVEWAKEWIREREGGGGEEGERESGVCVVEESDVGREGGRGEGGRTVIVQSKL